MLSKNKIKVLFVCMGNICRSPMAEAIFQKMVNENGFENFFDIASAATSKWELGNPVHPGTRLVLRNHNIPIASSKRAVQINQMDYDTYDYILVMDTENMSSMRKTGKVQRLMDYAPHLSRNVPDPYYTGDFETVFDMIHTACENFLSHLRQQYNF